VHVGNPFNSARRIQQKEDEIVSQYQNEMAEKERLRQTGYEGRKNVSEGLSGPGKGSYGGANKGYGGYGNNAMSNAERAKYQFEADESDDEKEKELEHNLDQIGNVVGRLNVLAKATGKEVDRQNLELNGINDKVDTVGVGIARNTHKLRGIK